MIGKVTPEQLEAVLEQVGADDAAVRQGPAYGEDAAAIDLGDDTLVVSSDPISLAAERIGTLGVHVACNDVAASGGDPRWLTNVVFLPGTGDLLGSITRQIDDAARGLGVAVVGGHSEYAPALERPMLSLTAMGLADRYIPTSGAAPGDLVVLTKGAGIEGTAVLATDFRGALEGRVEDATLQRAASFFEDISVVPEARVLRAHATAMHDPTEGGVTNGLVELARASGLAIEVERDAVPVREETRAVCAAMDVDPLRILGSGALLATVPAADRDAALGALEDADVEAAVVGRAVGGDPGLVLDGTRYGDAVRDDIYDLWN